MGDEQVVYVPKQLADAGLPAVHDPLDIIYSKFVGNNGEVVRVVKFNPKDCICRALYPTDNKKKFLGEVFENVDDPSTKIPINRSEINDDVWTDLLDNKDISEILSDYKSQSLGALPSGSYYYDYTGGVEDKTFHIVEMKEPEYEDSE